MQTFKQRIHPDTRQINYLRRHFGACRFVYNWALELRSRSWVESKTRLSGPDIGKRLTLLKQDPSHTWLQEISARCLLYSLMNLDTAMRKFFAKEARYPTFKRRRDFGGSAKFDTLQFKLIDGRLRLPKMDSLIRVRWTRELPCDPKFVTISQDSTGACWAAFSCEHTPEPLPPTNKEVGIDLGITSFATLSTGEKIKGPNLKRKTERVRILQRRASRRQRGSANRRRANKRTARARQRVTNTRKDFHHKLSRRLVDENQVIALETLAVSNMVRNRSLARSISEQGWTEFVRMLEYKAEWAGRTVIRVDRWFPSTKTCHDCGHVVSKLPLSAREWDCPCCGRSHDRDVNAARNILAAGRVVSACGVDGRPLAGSRSGAVGSEAGTVK